MPQLLSSTHLTSGFNIIKVQIWPRKFPLCIGLLNAQKIYNTQGAGAGRGFNELNQEVRHRQGGWGHSLDHPPFSDKSQNSDFFRKSFFFIWGGPYKTFLTPNDLIWP